MKASLHFNLNDQDDAMAHLRCVKALEMALAIWSFTQRFEQIVDTSENGKWIDQKDVRDALNETLYSYNIKLEELIS